MKTCCCDSLSLLCCNFLLMLAIPGKVKHMLNFEMSIIIF